VAEAAQGGERPLVIKVGGSLAETGRLASALKMIAEARVPVVIVPGGGPFADSVRVLQHTMRFNDATAHRLAMLAMHQMAEMMIALQKDFLIAETPEEIAEIVLDGAVPVWAPLRLMTGDAFVPSDWSATSDTLAARLAERLGSERLALLKSVDVEAGVNADELARRGVVDPVFPSIVARAGLSWSIFGPSDEAAFRAVLAGQGGA
jgi:aspartokinase-like uncharacterized kinase